HDIPDYSAAMQPGMVITIEPGLYIEEEAIGIRIEDDVLVTADGCEVLSSQIPKEIEEVELLIGKKE
ncbi:M24 family metallopeptidase, partial [Brevibacillus choshinensis]